MKDLIVLVQLITVLVFLILVALLIDMEWREGFDRDAHYCAMVEAGAWPAYKDLDCGEVKK